MENTLNNSGRQGRINLDSAGMACQDSRLLIDPTIYQVSMKVLLIGSGGREHAIAWALSRSPHVTKIYNNSANAGILSLAEFVNQSTLEGLATFAEKEGIDLTVVGPEQPLVDGIVDIFEARGLKVFGPCKAAAELEGSKIFAKEFMVKHQIPTARSESHFDLESAISSIKSARLGYPLVIKADGLAAGKGVVIAENETIAMETIQSFMGNQKLGAAGNKVLFEECLIGREISLLVIADGKDFVALPVAQDHKRAFDNDEGPNTGGMGVFSAPGLIDEVLEAQILKEIVAPSLAATKAEGFAFKGVLFIGLMLTAAGPKVLEYNVRFGDPETQAVLKRLDSDLFELLYAAAAGNLSTINPVWSQDSTCCVVMASAGYPESYEKGKIISGLNENFPEVTIFHAGTERNDSGAIVTNGGRVLGVTARGRDLNSAVDLAYRAVAGISFEGAFTRSDIGRK